MKFSINLTGDSDLARLAQFAPTETSGGTAISGDEDSTPRATKAFGAREDADATRQAQHREANDAVADVQMNDVYSREQGNTMVLMGKNFEANADRRNKIFDLISQIHGGRLALAKDGA